MVQDGSGQDGGDQAKYTAIKHRWTADTDHPTAPRVWSLGEETEGKTDEVRRKEAAEIAMVLHQIVGERWQVLDTRGIPMRRKLRNPKIPKIRSKWSAIKDAKYSDICILMPTRTALRTLELALDDANVPYRLEGASLFFDTQEVRDLLNCLRAIDNPSNEIAIVAALRSPAFACTDVELLRFHRVRRTFNYLAQRHSRKSDDDGFAKVAQALEVLREAHDRRMWTATAALIDGFIRDRLLMESAMSQQREREQWRRYRFLVEQARAFAAAGGNSLRAFLEWVQRQADEGARVTEAPVPESDEEAVRIMTVHGAKGLEFPVVVLTGLNVNRNIRVDTVIFDEGKVEVGIGNRTSRFLTAGYEALHEREKVLEDQEHVRLLYVATTRARDHLVLSMYRPDNRNSGLDSTQIAELLEDHDDLWEQIELRPEHQARAVAQEAQSAAQTRQPFDLAEHTVEAREEWHSRRQDVIDTQGRPASVAATSLAGVSKDESDADIDDWRTYSHQGAGEAVHRSAGPFTQSFRR